jgi:hypothetical protein
MKRLFLVLFNILVVVIFSFCTRVEGEKEDNGLKIKEVSLPLRLIKAKSQSSDSSQCLTLNSISERLNKHEGIQQPVLNFEYDDKWIISYKIKADKTFDIYVVEKNMSQDARAKMLITTKKEEPTAIISALMIAYDNYAEKPGKLETEEWEATIQEDLSLKVLKTYQVILADKKLDYIDINELSSSNRSKNEVEEFYQIESDGTISFVENVIFSKPEVVQPILNYRAIVAFKVLDENFEDINDEWMLNIAELEMLCQKFDIIFIQNYEDMSQIVIHDSDGNVKDTLNLSLYTKTASMGYVLLHSRKKHEFVNFQSIKGVLESISNYFNIDVLEDIP